MSADSDDSEDGDSSTGLTGSTPQTALSADQIINILQESPDLVVELKSELADRMQQQGMQIDPNDISDQMLYNQISYKRQPACKYHERSARARICIRRRPSVHGIKRSSRKTLPIPCPLRALHSRAVAMQQPRQDLPQAPA